MLLINLFIIYLLTFSNLLLAHPASAAQTTNTAPQYIAHAAGEASWYRYTNSLEALDNSYGKNFRYFEIDLETTKDGKIVLLHDWDYSMKHFYKTEEKIYTLEEFKKLTLRDNLTKMTWDDLAAWMKEHPSAYIITDVKRDPLKMLKKISELNPELKNQIIPQIYYFSQYSTVKKLGFTKIILTLYASNYYDWQIMYFTKSHPLWAVAMPATKALKGNLPRKLKNRGIPVYAHLVDTEKIKVELVQKGVTGIYTAYLKPN